MTKLTVVTKYANRDRNQRSEWEMDEDAYIEVLVGGMAVSLMVSTLGQVTLIVPHKDTAQPDTVLTAFIDELQHRKSDITFEVNGRVYLEER